MCREFLSVDYNTSQFSTQHIYIYTEGDREGSWWVLYGGILASCHARDILCFVG
jgi:hypothetical protein